MNEHQRVQAMKQIRYVLSIIKENAVDSADYRARHQQAILEAISSVKPEVEALLQDASQASEEMKAEREEIIRQLAHEANERSLTRSHFESDAAYEGWLVVCATPRTKTSVRRENVRELIQKYLCEPSNTIARWPLFVQVTDDSQDQKPSKNVKAKDNALAELSRHQSLEKR